MRTGLIIIIMGLLTFVCIGQEYKFSYLLPNPSIFDRDTILDPYSLKAKEVGKSGFSLKDSIYYFYWSITDSEWKNATSSLYSYNEDNRKDTILYREWGPDIWIDKNLHEYFYDDKGNRIQYIKKTWIHGEQRWRNEQQINYTFNDHNNVSSYIVEQWDENLLTWKTGVRYLYDYDDFQQLVYQERQTWNPDSLKWIEQYRFLWAYQDGNIIKELRQDWNSTDSSWINYVKDDYLYNQEGNLATDRQSIWNENDSIWEEKTVISFTFNTEEQVTEKLYQSWVNDLLVNFTLYTYQYTPLDQVSEIKGYLWDNSEWDTLSMYYFEYDLYGNLIREGTRDWSSSDQEWKNHALWEYYYTCFEDPLAAYISDSTNISCFGYSDGTATVTISGGTPPYSILWNDLQNTTNATVFGLSANQYYTVTITDADLNSVTDSVILSQPPEIITGPIYGEDNVNQNDTVTYWVESDPSAIYSWFVMNGQILSVAAGDSVTIVWMQSGQGKVSVIESNIFGCEGDTVHLNVSISPTGIDTQENPIFRIYPNPANQFVIIQLDNRNADTWDLIIYDMTGKIIRSFHSLTENRYPVSVDQMRRGIYFFKITTSSSIKIQKLVIER